MRGERSSIDKKTFDQEDRNDPLCTVTCNRLWSRGGWER